MGNGSSHRRLCCPQGDDDNKKNIRKGRSSKDVDRMSLSDLSREEVDKSPDSPVIMKIVDFGDEAEDLDASDPEEDKERQFHRKKLEQRELELKLRSSTEKQAVKSKSTEKIVVESEKRSLSSGKDVVDEAKQSTEDDVLAGGLVEDESEQELAKKQMESDMDSADLFNGIYSKSGSEIPAFMLSFYKDFSSFADTQHSGVGFDPRLLVACTVNELLSCSRNSLKTVQFLLESDPFIQGLRVVVLDNLSLRLLISNSWILKAIPSIQRKKPLFCFALGINDKTILTEGFGDILNLRPVLEPSFKPELTPEVLESCRSFLEFPKFDNLTFEIKLLSEEVMEELVKSLPLIESLKTLTLIFNDETIKSMKRAQVVCESFRSEVTNIVCKLNSCKLMSFKSLSEILSIVARNSSCIIIEYLGVRLEILSKSIRNKEFDGITDELLVSLKQIVSNFEVESSSACFQSEDFKETQPLLETMMCHIPSTVEHLSICAQDCDFGVLALFPKLKSLNLSVISDNLLYFIDILKSNLAELVHLQLNLVVSETASSKTLSENFSLLTEALTSKPKLLHVKLQFECRNFEYADIIKQVCSNSGNLNSFSVKINCRSFTGSSKLQPFELLKRNSSLLNFSLDVSPTISMPFKLKDFSGLLETNKSLTGLDTDLSFNSKKYWTRFIEVLKSNRSLVTMNVPVKLPTLFQSEILAIMIRNRIKLYNEKLIPLMSKEETKSILKGYSGLEDDKIVPMILSYQTFP